MAADDYYRKSGQIPAFGDWENVNELPITQYFECARQAGLLRCSCSGECRGSGALYGGLAYQKPLHRRVNAAPAPQRKTRGMNKGCQHSKEQRKQVTVVMDHQPRDHQHMISQKHNPNHHRDNKSANLNVQRSSINVKPVDEDLYKIPSELLENSKRKRMLGFFSRCMVPPCAA